MRRRMITMLALVLGFVGILGFIKFQQIRTAIAQGKNWAPPPEAVTTVVAQRAEWPATLSSIGSVAAVHGVTVSADMPGIVDKIEFESGQHVREGQVLVRLDTSQERAQLVSAEAQRELARVSLERAKKLIETQAIAQAEFDQISANSKSADARVGEVRAAIERKTIRAPFSGVIGIRQVSLGQYLAGGDPIAPVQSMDPVFVNFSVPQRDVASLRRGIKVLIASDSSATRAEGTVTAVNSLIDEATRNVQVQATFKNPHARLKPGMFVDVSIELGHSSAVIALPASSISYAPYGNSVFIVQEMKGPKGEKYRGVRQQFVTVANSRGDQVAVISGIKPGEEVVTSGVFKLRNGMAVLVNNANQPANSPTPKPEES